MTKWVEGIIQERIYISPYKDAVKAVGLKDRYTLYQYSARRLLTRTIDKEMTCNNLKDDYFTSI